VPAELSGSEYAMTFRNQMALFVIPVPFPKCETAVPKSLELLEGPIFGEQGTVF